MSAITHLAMPGRPYVASCGRWSKWTTSSVADVTCESCRATWDFALAELRCCPDCSPWRKHAPKITLRGVPRWRARDPRMERAS